MDLLTKLVQLVRAELYAVQHVPWRDLRFETPHVALVITGFLLLLLLFRKLRAKSRFFRQHSGHKIRQNVIKKVARKIFIVLSRITVCIAIAFLLLAVAKPYLVRTEKVEVIEARQRIDLIDLSQSMAVNFENTQKLKAEVAREKFLEFLELRRGQGDYACLWMFSNNAYMASECTTDEKAYYFQAKMAPYLLGTTGSQYTPQTRQIQGEGGTDLRKAFRTIISDFDRQRYPAYTKRPLLVITDADPEEYPDTELEDLRKRNIVPYIILIVNPGENIPNLPNNIQKLLDALPRYGGKYFDARNPQAVQEAFRTIDSFEKEQKEIPARQLKIPVFQQALFITFVFFAISTLLSLFIELFFREYP